MNLYPFQHFDESRTVIIAENPCPEQDLNLHDLAATSS
jgi:hypothetical protein